MAPLLLLLRINQFFLDSSRMRSQFSRLFAKAHSVLRARPCRTHARHRFPPSFPPYNGVSSDPNPSLSSLVGGDDMKIAVKSNGNIDFIGLTLSHSLFDEWVTTVTIYRHHRCSTRSNGHWLSLSPPLLLKKKQFAGRLKFQELATFSRWPLPSNGLGWRAEMEYFGFGTWSGWKKKTTTGGELMGWRRWMVGVIARFLDKYSSSACGNWKIMFMINKLVVVFLIKVLWIREVNYHNWRWKES